MNWKELPPPYNKQVLLKYQKGKEIVITQGYFENEPKRLARPNNDEQFWIRCGYGDCYFDYSRRQIESLTAKKSKNKVLNWMELP